MIYGPIFTKYGTALYHYTYAAACDFQMKNIDHLSKYAAIYTYNQD